MPLIRRKYKKIQENTLNGLTNSPKTFNIIKRDFFQPNCLQRDPGIL